MSKPICLLFALVILITVLCNNSVHPIKGIHCRNKNLKREYREIVGCICRNQETYFNEDSKKLFLRMCRSNSPSYPF
ncbi:hypothetical protein cypCar_00017285 [Cyprinus carpio]|nr:hypothetical protein cypCar_00017285 [Cyprinus carpio]